MEGKEIASAYHPKLYKVNLAVGRVSSATVNTLEDNAKDWPTDIWKNLICEIISGTGKGQIRKILSNTANALTLETGWTTNPDTTSEYRITLLGTIINAATVSDILKWGGTALTGRDISLDLANLDIALSTLAKHTDLYNDTDVKSAYDHLKSILAQLDVALSTVLAPEDLHLDAQKDLQVDVLSSLHTLLATTELLASAARTEDGDTSASPVDVSSVKEANFFLDVTDITVDTTITVAIKTEDPVSGKWFDLVSFTEATAIGSEMKTFPNCLGQNIAVFWTIGGTQVSPSITFSVGMVAKT